MEKTLLAFKAAVSAGISFLCAFLGWRGILLLVWIVAMGLDYLSGSAAACKTGTWSSAVARDGLWHKAGMILSVTVAFLADIVIKISCDHIPLGLEYPGVIVTLVLAWYILTELGSILENAVKLGAPIPPWLINFLAAVVHTVDNAGDKMVDAPTTDGLETYTEVVAEQLE
jgi:toxin secretion/phage lysis holin